jgi:Phosphotransferase enzyme family
VTISSALTPDIEDICRTRLGRRVTSVEPIGTGRNSRVFRAGLSKPETSDARDSETVVVKFYRHDPGDTRDRLAAEFNGLQFLWDNAIRAIAKPIAADRERYCGIYEYIAGAPVESVTERNIDQAVDFLASLKALREATDSRRQPNASEAHFSIRAIGQAVAGRLDRLRQCARSGDGVALHEWIDRVLDPLARKVAVWCRAEADRNGILSDAELDRGAQVLSPSDFGFHNAIRRPDGTLAFVDFEYFGWDDPAKTACDFVLHPGMALDDPLRHRFMKTFLSAFRDIPRLDDRVRIVYPLFGIKWCLIVLNDFLPGRETAVAAGELSAVRRTQLAKADALASRITREYSTNPYVL